MFRLGKTGFLKLERLDCGFRLASFLLGTKTHAICSTIFPSSCSSLLNLRFPIPKKTIPVKRMIF
jgi:hypothetical protein